MASNPLAEMLAAGEQRKELDKIEMLKRKGNEFIKVRYLGQAIFDADGRSSNVRMHGLIGMTAFETFDENNQSVWSAREGSVTLDVRRSSTGEAVADIYDDPDGRNRFWIARHLNKIAPDRNLLEVVDSTIEKQIEKLVGKKYKVELSKKDQLLRDRKKIEKQLQDLGGEIDELPDEEVDEEETVAEAVEVEETEEEDEEETEPVKPLANTRVKKTVPRRKKRVINGNNEPNTDVD